MGNSTSTRISAPPCISAADRIKVLEASAQAFSDHIVDTPGVVLTASQRWGVAVCARQAYSADCKGCVQISTICSPPGTFTALFDSVSHGPCFPDPATPKPLGELLQKLVHAMVSHQDRLNRDWYDSALQALDNCLSFPPNKDDKTTAYEGWLHAAMCEVIILTSVAHCFHVAFLAMGKYLPKLPTLDQVLAGKATQVGPTLLDWTGLLKEGKEIQYDADFCFAHYVPLSSIDQQGETFRAFSAETKTALKLTTEIFAKPYYTLVFSPEDARIMLACLGKFYMLDKVRFHGRIVKKISKLLFSPLPAIG
jgi:hypothetical protein